jgi:hypothetical protein
MPEIGIKRSVLDAAQKALGQVNVPIYRAWRSGGAIKFVTRFGEHTWTPPAEAEKPKLKPKRKRKKKEVTS